VFSEAYATTRYVAPDAEALPATYRGLQSGAYAEVGLVDRLQLAVSAPLVVGSSVTTVDSLGDTFDVRTTSVAFGDLWLGPQVALHPEVPLSARVDVKVPLYGLAAIGARDPVYGVLYPAPGDGQVDAVPWVAAGTAAGVVFAEAAVGWAFRTGLGFDAEARSFGDGPTALLKGGASSKGWLGWASVDGRWALWQRDETRQWVAAAIGGGRHLTGGLMLEARVMAELYTRAVSQGVGGGLGVSWQPPRDE
jgi:hypothetical protein